ncbi:12529_t:CDS:2 [Dentiscutata erythropus]|uniref:tRNA-uridine aminocarboxypropyltransferase 1 n=1 Tax=Dentiscutata erythropus TaxID=1348616 RepID=A0A9N8ZRT7_9GLOM|nr:12529_t:CDS:2 [Dentiscutata erythropus]
MTTDANDFEEPFLTDEQIQNIQNFDSLHTSSKISSPFDSLKISSTEILENIAERTHCPKCDKPVKFFCYWCYIVVGRDSKDLPRVKLPIKVDVIKHHKEKDGKSTVAHAKIIAPDDVEIISYSQMPKIENPDRLLLLFPGPNSKTLQEIPRSSFDKLIIVDGTWRQASNMAKNNPELKNIRKVTIKPQKTLFWRYQNKDEYHLSTIEALYYFLREYNEVYEIPEETENIHSDGNGYDGRYDNLLWYFKYFYEFIQATYRNQKGKKHFTTRQREGYIRYE